MSGVPFVRLRARSTRAGACMASIPSAVVFLASCASTAGSARYATMNADFARSAPNAPPPSGRERAEIQGPVLERAAYVRAVLRANPTIESARQGFRAALARVRQAG